MEISSVIAQDIVLELKDIIKQEINFMNKKSIIIASTDKNRIGDFHEGALKVFETEENLIIDSDDKYIGSKKGMNLPITFQQKIIGIVGITGKRSEVEKNGNIIKKMTEILIREDYINDIKLKKYERSRYIITSILNQQFTDNISSDVFSYDYSLEHLCIIGSYGDSTISADSYDEIYRIIDTHIPKDYKVISSIINHKVYFFVQNIKTEFIHSWLKTLAKQLSSYGDQPFYFGIGPISDSLASANKSFDYALDTLFWNTTHTQKKILHFDEMDIGLLLTSFDNNRVDIIKKRILGSIPIKEYEDLKTVLITYGNMNKSVSKSADELFIHKNTLQYKLNKIKEYTGYNPRLLNDYVCLHIAFLLNDPSSFTHLKTI